MAQNRHRHRRRHCPETGQHWKHNCFSATDFLWQWAQDYSASRTAASGLLCSVLVAGDNNFWSCCISIGWLILGIPISLPTVRKTLWAHSIKCTNLITHLPSHVCQTPSVQSMPVVAHCCRPEQTCQQRAARERFQNARTCLGEQRPSSTAENKTVLTMSFLRAT